EGQGAHVLVGLIAVAWVLDKLYRSQLRKPSLDTFSLYWHFTTTLWLYVLAILLITSKEPHELRHSIAEVWHAESREKRDGCGGVVQCCTGIRPGMCAVLYASRFRFRAVRPRAAQRNSRPGISSIAHLGGIGDGRLSKARQVPSQPCAVRTKRGFSRG